jgi:hypothetical protein
MATRQVTVLQDTMPNLLTRLQLVRGGDAVNDRQRTRSGWLGGTLLTLGILGGFFSLVLLGTYLPLGLFALLVSGLLLIGGIVFLVQFNQLKAADLDNDRLALAQELLETLAPDLSPKRPLHLSLWHGDCFHWGTVTGKRTEGYWLTGRTTYSEHADRWLSLSGRLQDGSVFKLSVTQSGKRKSKAKRKYTKMHERSEERVRLSLRVPPALYPHLDRLQGALLPDRLQGHAGLILRAFQVQGNVVRLTAESGLFVRQVLRYSRPEGGHEHRMTAGKLVSLLAFLYSGLSHCRPNASPVPQDAQLGPAPQEYRV